MPEFSVTGFDNEHFKRTEEYVKLIKNIYHAAIREATRLGVSVKYDPTKQFEFSKFPAIRKKIDKLFEGVSDKMQAVVIEGVEREWNHANDKNDAFVASVLKTDNMPERALARLFGRNQEALEAFKVRKSNGLNLSDRIWNQTNQFKSELEMALEVGIGEGKSADQISLDIRGYLENPDNLFRRVRNKENGMLRLSKHASNFNPGRGIYRSSFKNAQRVARTETNMAYRESDYQRFQKLDFIVGFEVKRSQNKTQCDVCESLKGKYPKNFKFVSWHPNCRCFVVSILANEKEMNDLELAMLNDEDTSDFKSSNSVNKMPEGWNSWVSENKDRLLISKSQPFFIKDNFEGGKITGKPLFTFGSIASREDVKRASGPFNRSRPLPRIPSKPEASPFDKPEPAVLRKPEPVKKSEQPEKKEKSKEKAKEPVESTLVPKNAEYFEEEMGVTIDKSIFDLLDNEVNFETYGNDSFYDPNRNLVNISTDAAYTDSKWKSESIVYHEFGHAIDFMNKMREMPEIKDLMSKYKDKYSINKEEKFKTLSGSLIKSALKANSKKDHDVIYQTSATLDTIMSLNSNYGHGHSKEYFNQRGLSEAEFIAHAFENKFSGNPVFKAAMPDLYDDMIKTLDKIISRLKKSKSK